MTTADGRRRLSVDDATLAYARRTISRGLSLTIPDGSFTVIIGPNGCGKSTLLRALARLLAPTAGAVLLDGRSVQSYPSKELARTIGFLPQSATAPDNITVADLVARGRYPHQGPLHRWSRRDEDALRTAMIATRTDALADRPVDELSGGQRQRVWIAMALAQQTPILLLDEPTTYLDIAFQLEVMDTLRDLHDHGRTLVAVLHDPNHAARYASHLIAMADGEIVAEGEPKTIITSELIDRVFGIDSTVIADPLDGAPLVIPRSRRDCPVTPGSGGPAVEAEKVIG
ncbi:putative ferric enterobactin transport ATP-binding protein [Nocardia nova SH22a]|uniref:Putative ferric enterobactin transport ATP-binding protein n=1 Tax=Nocardia nova SH22a TaxID=1415166 RepID=W5TGN9_9NOCA|nr:ABC transporter ATP-binding protein [Nocardia nova]AHH18357.1 putative ferric enterobactin transport ATP-binding protein [Nocardia nova SH22a]